MDRIDRRLDRELSQQTAAVGGVAAPARDYPDVRSYQRPGQNDPEPPTTNPPPAELGFPPADPERDVERVKERLRQYSLAAAGVHADADVLALDLHAAFRLAQRAGREYLNAEEEYILAAVRVLIERHLWSPRLTHSTSAVLSGSGDAGDFRSAVRVVNDLRLSQRLPYGGQVEARWVWEATEQLRQTASGRYRQSSEIVLSGNVPLLRGAGTVAREGLIQTERNLVYEARSFERFRRQFLVSIARDYFSLLESQAAIANQKLNLYNLRRLLDERQALHEAGRRSLFEVNQTRNDVLAAESTLENLRDQYAFQEGRFKIRLGLPIEQPVRITPHVIDLAEPDIGMDEATERALLYRLDLQNRRDQVVDARRGVGNARNNLLPSLDLTGNVSVPTDPTVREGGVVFDPEYTAYSAGVTFGLPLDREIERLQLRQAVISVDRRQRDLERFEDDLVLEVRQALSAIELARFNLRLAEERVLITLQRQEEQELKIDEVTTRDRLDAERDLLDALNARDRAQTRLRTAVLDYLLSTGQLRVSREGQLEELPGLGVRPVELFVGTEDLDQWYVDPPIPEYEPPAPPPDAPSP